MALFEKNQIPWNKGIPTTIKRCKDCGSFISDKSEHVCKSVDKKGIRYCNKCGAELKNSGWERYSKICGRCGKKIQRENERILRDELIKQFGGKCQKCEYDKVKECLEFHHLFKEDKRGKHFLKDIQKHPERYNLLCNRCHREIEVELKNKKMKHTLKGIASTREYFLDGKYLDPARSQRVWNHSPDGFNHGYSGSGPAQLALAIMLELTGKPDGYQNFKFKFVAALPQGQNFEVEFNDSNLL
jgi:hypothetical protein